MQIHSLLTKRLNFRLSFQKQKINTSDLIHKNKLQSWQRLPTISIYPATTTGIIKLK